MNKSAGQMNGYNAVQDDAEQVKCCLLDDGYRCHREAGNASYSNKIAKRASAQRHLKLGADVVASHSRICDYHKNMIQASSMKKKRKESLEETNDVEMEAPVPQVDFSQLQLQTLRKYRKFYNLGVKQGSNKAQLIEAISNHFKEIPVPNEKNELRYFMHSVKTNRSTDNKSGSDNNS